MADATGAAQTSSEYETGYTSATAQDNPASEQNMSSQDSRGFVDQGPSAQGFTDQGPPPPPAQPKVKSKLSANTSKGTSSSRSSTPPAPPLTEIYKPALPESKDLPKSPLATQKNLAQMQENFALNNEFSDEPEDRAAVYKKDREQLVEAAVRNPPAPFEFRGLQVGPESQVEYEPTSVQQVELSSSLLRRLSPFMIQVEPPIAFGEDGGFMSRRGNSIPVDTFGTAMRGYRGYEAARTALSQSTLAVGVNGKAGSVQEFIQTNSTNNPAVKRDRPDPVQGAGGHDLKQIKMGEPAIADLLSAADIAWQLSAAMQAPPLVLLINPQSLQMAYTKMQQFTDRTRFGFVFQAWGEEQPKLTITAKCGAFVSGQRGVQFASKRDSLAWQNLMNAFHLYRNNGYLYDTIGKSNAHHFVGALSIHYDQWVYYGHMESFNWTYEETNQQGGIEFSMEFTVSAMVDTAQQPFVVTPMRSPIPSESDPRYHGLENRAQNQPGEYSIGLDDSGKPRLTSQGRVVTSESFGMLVPGGLEEVIEAKTGWTKPAGGDVRGQYVSNKGFQSTVSTDITPGQRTVMTSASTRPFGLR